jgi:hypothetical protein
MLPISTNHCSECNDPASYFRRTPDGHLYYACTKHAVGHIGEWQAVGTIQERAASLKETLREGVKRR